MATSINNQAETVYVDSSEVQCEGPSAALGHPRIYLNLGKKDEIDCPYCSRKFVRKKK